jgi:hypothetical protein
MTLAYELNLGPRDLKAWSQNLGHESVLTTLGSYGELSPREQAETMRRLGMRRAESLSTKPDLADLLRQAVSLIETRPEA